MKASWLSDEPRSLNRVSCGGLLRRANPCYSRTTMVHVSIGQQGVNTTAPQPPTPEMSPDTPAQPVCANSGPFNPLCSRASRLSVTGGAYANELTAAPEAE